MTTSMTFILSLILGISFNSDPEIPVQEDAITTYYFIRHAEKDRSDSTNPNPDLNEKGKQRAEKWSEALKNIKFDAIYSTDYNRTIQTATPLARQNNLQILNYDPDNLYSEKFRSATTGKIVLVVGHSNTTPQFVNAILGEEKYQNIDDNENGALFIVHVLSDGEVISEVLYFN